MAKSSTYLLVAAIDFGTTFSGYAFSFRNQYVDDPTKISGRVWRRESVSLKAPTCILLKPDKTFAAFGYDAEEKYNDLASKDQHSDWYFFKHFKMKLSETGLKRDIQLEDATGKKLSGMKIFTLAITYLKDHMMEMCKKQTTVLNDEDVRWVLTTPAIWSDAAKQFMREAAVKAGINNDNLVIALEPEVAAIYCRHIKLQRAEKTDGGAEIAVFSTGTRYAVLDAGGGTIDITVHEVNPDGTVKEVYQANGGPWGGTMVDEQFRQILIKIFGDPIMHKFQKKFFDDYIDLMRDFEMYKKDIDPSSDSKVRFKVPAELRQIFEKQTRKNIEEVISQMDIRDGVEWKKDKMHLTAETMKQFFESPVQKATQHIKNILENNNISVSHILMVGGFSDSAMLQHSIKSALHPITVLIPDDASNAILKGAVIYGHDASCITHRKCRYTYGVKVSDPFVEGKHDEKRRFTDERGQKKCRDCFSLHATLGQVLRCGEWLEEMSYVVEESGQTGMTFLVYGSKVKFPTYTNDPGCIKLGILTIPMLDTTDGLDRGAYVQMCFSGTEMLVRARDRKSGKTVKTSFNFLG